MQEVHDEQDHMEVEKKQQEETKDFANHFPAVQIVAKHYSLDADIATGWKPKIRLLGPIPLNFDSKIVDEIVDQLTSFGRKYKERVIYLGNRYESSFKMHQQIKRQYEFKHESVLNTNYLHMAAYFRKFHSNFKSKSTRIFRGMNPTIPKDEELIFDSNFQSGNLDVSIKVSENEYDLFMRSDSNTKGHTQWFNFTLKNCGKKKIKLNIINFKKCKTMYTRGMKPYIHSNYLKQLNQSGWIQGGENVKFERKKLRYDFLSFEFTEQQMTFNTLTFSYEFNTDWEEVQFAYAPPFTYSDNVKMIKEMRLMNRQLMKNSHSIDNYLKQEILTQSLGGLEIPLLTVTDPTVDNKKKRCIVLSGRIHPGEPCGSYMMKGFLNFILSEKDEAKYLRESIVFKLIPMLNPDGVTIGNFRTSLCGKDLNRTFKIPNQLLIPEVKALKQLVAKLKQEWKTRLIMFFDMHGHSVKKNVFLYGPQYEIWEPGYYKTRIFPKLLADNTEIFRYYSCLFRIAQFKKTTARAVILKYIPHCYTIEASTGFYYSYDEKKDIPFTTEKYELMGDKVASTLKDYLELLYDQEQSRLQRKQKMTELKIQKSNRAKSKKDNQRQRNVKAKFHTRRINNPSLTTKQQQVDEQSPKKEPFSYMSQKARQLIEKIKKQEEQERSNLIEEGHQSDKFSEGGSDSQSDSDDFNDEELNKLHQGIIESMKEFREKMGMKEVKNSRQSSFMQEPKKKSSFKEKPKIQLIASLRNKMEKFDSNQVRDSKNFSLKPIREDIRLQKIKGSSSSINKNSQGFVNKPAVKSSISRLQQLQYQNQEQTRKIFQEGLEQSQSPSKPFLNKISFGQLSLMAKSRLNSLIQKHDQIGDYNELRQYIEQECNAVTEVDIITQNKEFQDLQNYIKSQANRWSLSSNEGRIQIINNPQIPLRSVPNQQGRSLTSKLKKAMQTPQRMNLFASNNFVTSSAIINKYGFNNGMSIIKYESTNLER